MAFESTSDPGETGAYDLAIVGGRVLGLDGAFRRQAVAVTGQIIAFVGESLPAPARRTIDAAGTLVVPGLINMHDHLRNVAPGLSVGEGLPLDALLRVSWQLLESQGEAEYHLSTLAACCRLLKAGVTTVVDHAYTFHRPRLEEPILAAYRQSGIRWYFARGIMTRPYEPICETLDAALERIRELASEPEMRERLLVAPVSLRQATPADFKASRQLADELGLRVYTHLAETEAEVSDALRDSGKRPVQLMRDVGFTGADVVLVHCLKVDETGRAILRDTQTNVVHCPSNHMKLAKGVTDVPGFLSQGINVSLGIDQMSDPFTEMRNELLMQSLANLNPTALSREQVVAMATRNAAKALDQLDQLGAITPGARADLVLLDVTGLHHAPLVDPLYELVFNSRPSDVKMVLVDGEPVVEDGQLTSVDEAGLAAEVQDMLCHYLRRTGYDRPAAEKLECPVAAA